MRYIREDTFHTIVQAHLEDSSVPFEDFLKRQRMSPQLEELKVFAEMLGNMGVEFPLPEPPTTATPSAAAAAAPAAAPEYVLIDPTWILSTHVMDTVNFGGRVYKGKRNPPMYYENGVLFFLIQLDRPVFDIQPVNRYARQVRLGNIQLNAEMNNWINNHIIAEALRSP